VVGVCTAVISGGLTGRIVKWLGEKRTLYTGQFFGALGMIIAGLARTGAVYIASIPVISMWNISFPAAQGIMTHHVSEREQGELQGAISSLRSIAFVIGPFLFSWIFKWSIDSSHSIKVPGAGYFLAAALLFTAAVLATRVEQPRFAVQPTPDVPDIVPPEGVTSGTVAPMLDSQEKI
jgi:DHA1 family tetracycline resistance protein-like MFS transporter